MRTGSLGVCRGPWPGWSGVAISTKMTGWRPPTRSAWASVDFQSDSVMDAFARSASQWPSASLLLESDGAEHASAPAVLRMAADDSETA